MPSWHYAATFLAFTVIAAVIAFAGHSHHDGVTSADDTKVAIVAKSRAARP